VIDMGRVRKGRITLFVPSAIALTLIAGCSAAPTSTTSTPAVLQASVSLTLPTNVYDLAYNPLTSTIWYATMSLAGPANLVEADAGTGNVKAQFPIPQAASNGLQSEIRIAPDGSVWVSEPYALVRVDPASGVVDSLSLSNSDPGVPASATDPGSLRPGSWITSLSVTSNSVLVGRNNVPFLQQWSLGLQPLGNVALPSGDSGPTDITTDSSGLVMAFLSSSDETDAGQLVTLPFPAGTAEPTAPDGSAVQAAYLDVRQGPNAALVSLTGNPILTLDPGIGQLSWTSPGGSSYLIPWPMVTSDVLNPLGQEVPAKGEPQLLAAAVLPEGIWIIKSGGMNSTLQLYTTPKS
jgi:hypothetical protein